MPFHVFWNQVCHRTQACERTRYQFMITLINHNIFQDRKSVDNF